MSRWMIPFWCACWIARQTGANSSRRSLGESWLRSQYSVIGDALDQLHDEVGPAGVGGAGVEHPGDVGVVHHRQGLPLGLEAGDHLGGVHPRLDDLDGDLAADGLGLLGHVDDAHAPLADRLEQLVGPDARPRPFEDRPGPGRDGRSVQSPRGRRRSPGDSMKLPAPSMASSSRSTRWRSSALSPQARSRKAARSAGSVLSRASRKMVRSEPVMAKSPLGRRPMPPTSATALSSMRRPGRSSRQNLSGRSRGSYSGSISRRSQARA